MIKRCPVCKKEFEVLYPDQWAYHENRKTYYCSWSCFRRKENEPVNMLEKEQKEKAVEIAMAGGDYIGHLRECGSKNPSGAWFYIKKKLEKDDPDKFEELEKALHRKANQKWKEKKESEKQQLQLEAGANYEVSVAEMPEAAVVEMTRKNPRTPKPAEVNGLMVTAVTHPDLGEWYFDRKFNSIDWRTPEGDEVSLPPSWWMMMTAELPKVLRALGVDV